MKPRSHMKGIHFMYNGIKVDGVLFKGSYHKFPDGTISLYGETLPNLPGEYDVYQDKNAYCRKDEIPVVPQNSLYPQVLAAYEKQEMLKTKWKEKRKQKQEVTL